MSYYVPPIVPVSYTHAFDLLEEADVLLFRDNTWFSPLIKLATNSLYTHVGLASKNHSCNMWEIIQFHGMTGGDIKNLALVSHGKKCLIDVYRPSPQDEKVYFLPKKNCVITTTHNLEQYEVTSTMRRMTGMPYGWHRIVWMFLHTLFVYRLLQSKKTLITDIKRQTIVYPVCSTAIAYSFAHHDFYLLKNQPYEYITPGEIARSPNLDYLFTICWNPSTDDQFLPNFHYFS